MWRKLPPPCCYVPKLFFHNDVAYKWFMVYEMFYAVYVNHTKYGYCKIIQLP